jgi:hydrogenase expression/formation protein HypE
VSDPKRVGMKHGAGGRAMRSLIETLFLRGAGEIPVDGFGLEALDDGAAIRLGDSWLVLTTDSHVVKPRFFPGGDIGRLAISGTVNDLAMMGATRVLGLTSGVVIEDGFAREELERIQASMHQTCLEARAPIVTGDTKVMGRGELDGLIINTSGAGLTQQLVRDNGLRPGDRLIVTGNVGDHGLAVLAARSALELEGELRSDVAPIGALVAAALAAGGSAIVAMKDPTRGGVAASLHEMATKSGVGIVIDEAAIPVSAAARAAAEILGIDPLYVANEGKAVIGVAPEAAERVLEAVRAHPLGRGAAIIGTATADQVGRVILDTGLGRRLVGELEGELLPRIC